MYSTLLLDWNKFPKNEWNNNLLLLNPEHRFPFWLTHLLSNCCNVSTVPHGVVDVFQHACFKVTRSVCVSQIFLEFLQKYKDHLILVALKRTSVCETPVLEVIRRVNCDRLSKYFAPTSHNQSEAITYISLDIIFKYFPTLALA